MTPLAAVPVALSAGAAALMPSSGKSWLFSLVAAVFVVWIHLTITAYVPGDIGVKCVNGGLPSGGLQWLPGTQLRNSGGD